MKSMMIKWYTMTMIIAILALMEKTYGMDIFGAVMKNSMSDIKQILKEHGKEKIINELGPGGQTPLMHAVLSGKIQAVKYLLKQGADVTIGEKDGYTRKSFHNISVIYIYYFICSWYILYLLT